LGRGRLERKCAASIKSLFSSRIFIRTERSILALITKIETNIFDGKRTDWGGWVARISKDQLLAFIHELYGDYEKSPSLEELRDYVATLDPEKRYALVAAEL
jgi:hypothetical protein